MPRTEDYEHLLQLDGVVGLEYDGDRDEVVVLVEQKIPEDQLEETQVIANNVRGKSDVRPVGQISLEDIQPHPDYRSRQRPVEGSLSEGPADVYSAGTGGPLARVTDPDSEHWADDVSEGDLVRISNNHVYAGAQDEPGHFGTEILQPGKLDQGSPSDVVGELVGYVDFEDGVRADCAARSASTDEDLAHAGLETDADTVRRDYSTLKGETVEKTGRTTGHTEGQIQATSATIRVRMDPDSEQTVTFRDQLVAGDMSDSGDSGSAVFDSEGRLVGLLFAGSGSVTVINKIANVEDAFDVEFAPDLEEDDGGEEGNESPGQESTRILSVGPGTHSPNSFAFSFDVDDAANVDVLGGSNSTEIVGDRVNAYVASWTNDYRIAADGEILEQSIPERAHVELDGETVDPADLPDRL